MKRIPLTQGKSALVDDADFAELNQHKWYAYENGRTFYAGRSLTTGINKQTMLPMHRAILALQQGELCDHIDHNGLNNQRHNIRAASYTQNNTNTRSHTGSTSNHLGVSWNASRKKWIAQIQKKRQGKYIGAFDDEMRAALAYDIEALCAHGLFASLNFPQTEETKKFIGQLLEVV